MSASYDRGSFVWYDLMTTDPAAAQDFYKRVIGWQTQRFGDSHYIMWVGSQGPMGGVMELPEEARKMGAPPHWIGNAMVDDVDRAVVRVRELGGQVLNPPSDIPTVGRFAVIADPQGAILSLFTPAGSMAAMERRKHGYVWWNELATSDHKASFRFYSEILGWKQISTFDMGEMGEYLLYGKGETTLGGMFTLPSAMGRPASWIYYIHVDDLDQAIERATSAGAKLVNGPMSVPDGDRIAQLMDPQGAFFALHAAGVKK